MRIEGGSRIALTKEQYENIMKWRQPLDTDKFFYNSDRISKEYHSELLTQYVIDQAGGYAESNTGAHYHGKPPQLYPRLFGFRAIRTELFDEQDQPTELLMTKVQELMTDLDRVFIPSNFEYMDGAIPADDGQLEIHRIVQWIPLEVVPLPRVDHRDGTDCVVRLVINVEYQKKTPSEE